MNDQPRLTDQNAKIIKSVQTTKFEVGLFELPSGQYVVAYTTMLTEEPIFGEPVSDYGTADFMYGLKLKELEGH